MVQKLMKKCHICGTMNYAANSECTNCGADISNEQNMAVDENGNQVIVENSQDDSHLSKMNSHIEYDNNDELYYSSSGNFTWTGLMTILASIGEGILILFIIISIFTPNMAVWPFLMAAILNIPSIGMLWELKEVVEQRKM